MFIGAEPTGAMGHLPRQTYIFAPVLFGPEFHLLYLVIRVWYAERNA